MIETTLSGAGAATAFAPESLAAEAFGGVYRGATGAAQRIIVTARERDTVLRVLPAAKMLEDDARDELPAIAARWPC